MKSFFNQLDPLSRRQFAMRTAKTALGVSLLPFGAGSRAMAAEGAGFGKAKHVIFLYMSGGMTHIDTFDPKDGSTKSPKAPIKTKADGIDRMGGYLPKLAEQAKKMTIVRSMTSKTGVHEAGSYIMKTGYEPRGTIIHPSMGAWASHFQGRIKGVMLPDSVTVGGGGGHPGAGFFPPSLSPVPISSAEAGLQNIRPSSGDDVFQKRVSLMNEFDSGFRNKFKSEDVKAYTEFYEETMKLLKSEDLKAFDISQESAETKAKYGPGFGAGCLLARRLVEHGVRFVEVNLGGWDMHNTIDTAMDRNGATLDTGFAALLQDLEDKGLLESTLVCLGSEFGRTPDINENDGRDHYPSAYSTVFAGAGIKGGYVHGSTDKDGRKVADKQATPSDFQATIGHAMGLPVDEVVMSPSNRPFTVGDKGNPILDIFA
jgi:hypothetical protein